jgi:hypothetical protein
MRKVAWSALFFLLGALVVTSIQSASASDADCCAALERRVEALERKVALLESAIRVSSDSVSIRGRNIAITGTTILVKAEADLRLKGASIRQN